MELSAKLHSLKPEEIITELNKMLEHAHVTVSWHGHRLVSVSGYKGSVEINALASKYLHSLPLIDHHIMSHEDKLSGNKLWGKIRQLYNDSNRKLREFYLYKYLPFWCHYNKERLEIPHEWDPTTFQDPPFEFIANDVEKRLTDDECPVSEDSSEKITRTTSTPHLLPLNNTKPSITIRRYTDTLPRRSFSLRQYHKTLVTQRALKQEVTQSKLSLNMSSLLGEPFGTAL